MTKPPIRHSQADPGLGARLVAPSAARNLDPLCALLEQFAPSRGRALEIASGTGQHVAGFAARLPGLHWQPSDPDAARRASMGIAESLIRVSVGIEDTEDLLEDFRAAL